MPSKEKILQQAYDLAYGYESTRGSCPQCVLAAIYETLNIGDPVTFKAADILAGGTALSAQGTCGALIGGLLSLSSIVGRSYSEFSDGQKKRKAFFYGKILYDRFVKEYGSPLCVGVQYKLFGKCYKLFDKEEYAAFEKAGAHVDKCPSVAGNAARWTAEILIDDLKIMKNMQK
jgi:C_GCAxxG_C_C family probable redox protein